MNISDKIILIVDDDRVYSFMLKHRLEEFVKHIEITNNAERGTFYVSSLKPDIIFLDNVLPKLNGKEVVNLYKELSPDSTLILLSSTYSVTDIAEAIQSGADYVIDKSDFSNTDLKLIMEASVRAKEEDETYWKVFDFLRKKKNTSINKKIAIVEDDEVFSLHLDQILKKSAYNHQVSRFSNAATFYGYCDNEKPDYVLLDYNLPDANGEEVLKFIKDKSPNSKVILISATKNADIALNMSKIGIDNYIIKNENWKYNFETILNQFNLLHNS